MKTGGRVSAEDIRRLDDRALAEALRHGDASAMREFVRRFRRLLMNRVRAAGLDAGDCEDVAMEVLFRIASGLASGRLVVTRSVAAYVVQSFWRRWHQQHQREARRNERLDRAMRPAPGAGEWLVDSVCSEYTRRLAAGAEWQPRDSRQCWRGWCGRS